MLKCDRRVVNFNRKDNLATHKKPMIVWCFHVLYPMYTQF